MDPPTDFLTLSSLIRSNIIWVNMTVNRAIECRHMQLLAGVRKVGKANNSPEVITSGRRNSLPNP